MNKYVRESNAQIRKKLQKVARKKHTTLSPEHIFCDKQLCSFSVRQAVCPLKQSISLLCASF